MKRKRIFKLKRPAKILLGTIGTILVLTLFLFIIYRNNVNQLKEHGYSEKAATVIMKKFKKDYCMSRAENKTLNAAFESEDYKEENLDSYSKIKYQDHKNLIKNINTLIKKKYSNSEISIILAHGDDEDVKEFARRDKIKYLEEFYSIDYAKLKYYDRYIAYMEETSEDEETTVLHVNLNMDQEEYTNAIVIKKFDAHVLVNKYRKLSETYEPDDLESIEVEYAKDKDQKGSKEAVTALMKMIKAAEKEDYHLIVNSSYRSYEDQEEIVKTYLDLYGENYVKNYISQAGHSEHQTGYAFDLGSKTTNVFRNSKEFAWMQENGYKYGFIYRYPKNKENITGFQNEPWHYRYVGKDIAKYCNDNNLTFDEYYVMFLDK